MCTSCVESLPLRVPLSISVPDLSPFSPRGHRFKVRCLCKSSWTRGIHISSWPEFEPNSCANPNRAGRARPNLLSCYLLPAEHPTPRVFSKLLVTKLPNFTVICPQRKLVEGSEGEVWSATDAAGAEVRRFISPHPRIILCHGSENLLPVKNAPRTKVDVASTSQTNPI